MKTILITWWTWFLWSNLLKQLILNYKVILLKRNFSNTNKIKELINNKNLIILNIDKNNIENIFKKNNINHIIHTATCYWRNNESLEEIIKVNLLFPLKLLELAKKYNIYKFINIDTNLPNNINYYSISKKQFCDYAKIKSNSNNIQFINLKSEHFYWPWDDNKKFIPFLIESLKSKNEVNLTKWEQKRDFIYIDDLVNICIFLLNKDIKQSFYELEIWTWKNIMIKDLVIYLKEKINKNSKLNFWALEYRKWEPMNKKANIKKLKQLWFNSFIDIYKWLDKTIEYYINKK